LLGCQFSENEIPNTLIFKRKINGSHADKSGLLGFVNLKADEPVLFLA
tara:strand:- start:4426 stop:4569 length:144 start_codon:yes stop_codon:yes gene_type:complete